MFPCEKAEKASVSFSEKLDSGHKALCPWKENACSETLAQFPPTPLEVLAEGFKDRCKELSQLPALPVISDAAIQYLKVPRLIVFFCSQILILWLLTG